MTTVLFVALVATVQAPAGILADVKVGCSKITLTLITSVPEVFKLKRGDWLKKIAVFHQNFKKGHFVAAQLKAVF